MRGFSMHRQGKSGLGLRAQSRKAVQACADAEAFQIVSEYVEVETGKGRAPTGASASSGSG